VAGYNQDGLPVDGHPSEY